MMFPQAREGQTVTLIADTHSGRYFSNGATGRPGLAQTLTTQQHRMIGIDLDMLSDYSTVVGVAGDLVDWREASSDAPEDAKFLSFYNPRKNRASKYIKCSGNHDLSGYSSASPPWRTGDVWASAQATTKFSHIPAGDTANHGVQVVSLSQETMKFNEWLRPDRAAADGRPAVLPGRGFQLTDNPNNPYDTSTGFGYLRSRLATGRPTWIMQHYPLVQHYSSVDMDVTTQQKFTDIITAFPNVIGVLSGHRHANPRYDTTHIRAVNVTGNGHTVTVAGINGGPSGGAMAQSTGPAFVSPFGDIFTATVVTYSPGKVIVRWRDLIRRAWINGPWGSHVFEMNISCTAPTRQI